MENGTMPDDKKDFFYLDRKELEEIINKYEATKDLPSIEEIWISKDESCELKKSIYEAASNSNDLDIFNNIYFGISVKEKDHVVKNMIVYKYSNNTARFFIYKNNKLYKFNSDFFKFHPGFQPIA